jgi:hypothetical protein
MRSSPMFANAQVQLSPAITAYNAVLQVIWLALSITLLMIGVGGMTLKPWARRIAISWSIISIFVAIIQTVISMIWIAPAQIAALRKTQPGNPMLQFGTGVFSAVSIVGLILVCILPVLFLILWRRPEVKNAFGESSM